MNTRVNSLIIMWMVILGLLLSMAVDIGAQHKDKPRPEAWKEDAGEAYTLDFDGKGNGITESNFIGKLFGKTKEGKLLFGYVRLPDLEKGDNKLGV